MAGSTHKTTESRSEKRNLRNWRRGFCCVEGKATAGQKRDDMPFDPLETDAKSRETKGDAAWIILVRTVWRRFGWVRMVRDENWWLRSASFLPFPSLLNGTNGKRGMEAKPFIWRYDWRLQEDRTTLLWSDKIKGY